MKEKFLDLENRMILKNSFIFTFVLGLVAHGYCFLNILLSHDSLNDFYAASKWQKASMGRIFYSVYISFTRGRIVIPWLIGIFSLCWVAIAVFLLCKIFEVNNSKIICLFAGVSITNPTVYALAATYIHDLDADLFALFLSVLSVFLWKKAIYEDKFKEKCWLLLGSSLSLSITLGIYQSYLSVTLVLMMLACMQHAFSNQECKGIIRDGIWGILSVFLAGGLYYVELIVFSMLTGVSALDSRNYNGLGNISESFSGNIIEKILDIYIFFVEAFKKLILTSYPEKITLFIQVIMVLSMCVIALNMLKKINWENKILLIVLGCLLPFGMNATYLLSNGVMHDLMQYAVYLIYVFALLLVLWAESSEMEKSKMLDISRAIVLIAVCLTILENIQTSNAIYVKKDLEYQTTLSYMTRVADRMEEQEDYIPGETPVIFVGNLEIGNYKYGFERYNFITGIGVSSSITYYETLEDYFEYVLGRPLNLTENTIEMSDEMIKEMNSFPKKDSVIMKDGTLVVKLAGEI